jgi:hypothetical protein
MNQKHIPAQGFFSPLLSFKNFRPPPPSPHFLLTPLPELKRAPNLEQLKASKRCEAQRLRKVESSTLKERGEEKARGKLHFKCKSMRR